MHLRQDILTLLIALTPTLGARAQYNVDRLLTGGRIALHYEDYVLSIQYFNQAINQKPYLWEPWQLRSIAKYYLDDWHGAYADASKAIELNPYVTELYDLRGITAIKQNLYDQAIKDYTKAIQQQPANWNYWYNRAVCYLEKASYDTASVQLDTIMAKWPKKAEPLLMKAEICLHQKDTTAAETWVNSSIKLDKYNTEAWRMSGMLALRRNDWQTADTALSKALHLRPKDTGCYINRALARLRLNNLRGAMDDYNSALEFDPNNFLAHYNRGLLRQNLGDDNRAIDDFNFVLKLEPSNVMALFNRATLLDRTGDLRGAIRDYTKVIDIFPNFWTGLQFRAACYRKLGLTAKAEMDEFRIMKAQMDKHQGVQRRWGKAKLNAMRSLSDIDPEKYDQLVVEDNVTEGHQYESAYRGKVQNQRTNTQLLPYLAIIVQHNAARQMTAIPYDSQTGETISLLSALQPIKGSSFALSIGHVGNGTGIELLTFVDIITEKIDTEQDNLETLAQLYLLRAVFNASAQDYKSAVHDLDQHLKYAKPSATALWMRAVCTAMLADYERTAAAKPSAAATATTATSAITAASSASAASAATVPSLQQLTDRQLQAASITADFKRAVQQAPDNAIILYSYATYLARQGNSAEAVDLYNKLLQHTPSMAQAYFNRALLLLPTNQAAAEADLSKAGELGLYNAYSILKQTVKGKKNNKNK